MKDTSNLNTPTRRRFLRYLALITVAGRTLMRTRDVGAAVPEATKTTTASWPKMTYRRLGRTGFEGSRLVFGCGAALSRQPREDLLSSAFDAGVNVFDVGTARYYKDAEKNLAAFAKAKRDKILLISKASVYIDIDADQTVSVAQAKEGAETWLGLLDQSLRDLKTDHIDAYYMMAANNPSIVRSEELRKAFLRAQKAGKVKYWGISTHENAQNVLEAAIATGWYDLAQIAITPAGWYSWADRNILPNSPDMVRLQPLLQQARQSGIGLIGMKAGRFLAGRKWLGWGNPDAFNTYYAPDLLKSNLSAFQRSYAFVLAHGLDAVNADMQSPAHLEENFTATATAQEYFA